MEADPAKKLLRRARTMLILGDGDEPFFGSIAMGLDLIPTTACPTAATDGKRLWYNNDWILTLNPQQAMFVFEHEVLHIAFKHGKLVLEIYKETDFDQKLWQQACDHPVNGILLKRGRKPPPLPNGNPIVYDPRFDGMSAFRVYRMLLKEKKDFLKQFEANVEPPSEVPFPTNPNVDDFIKDTGNLGGIIPTTNEKGEIANDEDLDQAEKDFEMVVMNSARVLMKALGSDVGDIPGFVKEIIESHTQPQRTYKDDILDIMEEITRDDYSWAYPNKKYDIYLPSLHDLVLAELVVIVDSSGSVSQTELEVYAAEISGILTEFQGLQIHVIFHHVQAYHIETYTSDDFPISFGHIISGGTDYKHAYKRIEEEGYEPKVILHFTDLNVNKSSYPEKEPEFPVFWMNTSPRKSDGSLRHSRPPWGTVIDLDPYI